MMLLFYGVRLELAMRVFFSQVGLSLENSQSDYSGRVSEMGRVTSLINARPVGYHSRLIIDSEG